jgi:hypothetical protein
VLLYVHAEFVFIFIFSHILFIFFKGAGNICVYNSVTIFWNCCLTYATNKILFQYPFYRYFHGSPIIDITCQVPEHFTKDWRCYVLVSATHSLVLVTDESARVFVKLRRSGVQKIPGTQFPR